jgi:hypothetical protein
MVENRVFGLQAGHFFALHDLNQSELGADRLKMELQLRVGVRAVYSS